MTTQVTSIAACLPEQFIAMAAARPRRGHASALGRPAGVRVASGGRTRRARAREDAAHAVDVERLARVRGAGQREQLGRQVEPEPTIADRLERLVARARQDRRVDVADRPVDRAVAASATTEP